MNIFPLASGCCVFAIFVIISVLAYLGGNWLLSVISFVLGLIATYIVIVGINVNNPWEQAVILRLGRFSRITTAGLFGIIPLLENKVMVDTRVRTDPFSAEEALTKDNVPVNVDAILFWKVVDVKRAVLEVQDYRTNTIRASMTTLRDIIGKSVLDQMIAERETLDGMLKTAIEDKANAWGVHVGSVEIRDVRIPAQLQDAMSRQAQAERERLARISLWDSEIQVAKKFEEASRVYEKNPHAMQLRAMNMLYEAVKERGTFIIVPSDVVKTMGWSGTLGAVGFAESQKKKDSEAS